MLNQRSRSIHLSHRETCPSELGHPQPAAIGAERGRSGTGPDLRGKLVRLRRGPARACRFDLASPGLAPDPHRAARADRNLSRFGATIVEPVPAVVYQDVKASFIVGLILVAGGLFLILRPPHYASQQSLFKVGGVHASIRQDKTLPGWVGGTVLGAGVLLLGVALMKRL